MRIIKIPILTVNCPLGVSGGSQVITMVDDDKGRTCTLRGALSISENDRKERNFHNNLEKILNNI